LPLIDDNCDGAADQHDRARVLAMTAGGPEHGVLHALSFREGAMVEDWSAGPGEGSLNDPTAATAAARSTDGSGIIAVCTEDERIRAYDGEGNELWLGPVSTLCDSLAIADIGGSSKVVSESQILDASGALVADYGPAPSHGFVVVDIEDNATGLEILTAAVVYDSSGAFIMDTGLGGEYVAVGDFEGDNSPIKDLEVVGIDPDQARLSLWRMSGGAVATPLRTGIDLHAALPIACPPASPGATASGGLPLLSDITGDGYLDVGVATARGYVVYDGVKLLNSMVTDENTVAWAIPRLDCDGGLRGSTAFDFDRDGSAEVLAGNDSLMALFDTAGNELESWCNTAEPGHAHPLVVDLDGDGFVEVVTPESARGATTCSGQMNAGVSLRQPVERVVRSRATHNELSYRVANVLDDGRLALTPDAHLAAPLMRANPADGNAPDVLVEWQSCSPTLRVRIKNQGRVSLGAGQAVVTFIAEVDDLPIGSVPLAVSLGPGVGIDVELATAYSGPVRAEIVGDLGECRVDNNSVAYYCP
jgi:hypothetical protein